MTGSKKNKKKPIIYVFAKYILAVLSKRSLVMIGSWDWLHISDTDNEETDGFDSK